MRTSRFPTAALAAALAGTAACATGGTTFDSTWQDPAVRSIEFNKVLTVSIGKDDGQRRTIEDRMAQAIMARGRAGAVPAYSILSAAEVRDTAISRAKVEAAGVDGLVTVRVVGTQTEQQLVSGAPMPSYYASPWGYYGYGWGVAYSPSYLVTDTEIQVETNIYSLKENRLIWSARTRTLNPESVNQMVDEVARAVGDELRRQGLIGSGS
ncbi:MAG TPA: hypothetical protein VJ773_02160 [Gemmatimonadales bacterium]|nr:hypothetical protein [Gemmatimonadales bacterium]